MQDQNEEKVFYKGMMIVVICGVLFMAFFYAINGGF